METHPSISNTYVNIWLNCFNKNKKEFKFIMGLNFFKSKLLPIYINIGSKISLGLSYSLSNEDFLDYKGKVFFINDVPSYFNLPDNKLKGSLKLIKLRRKKAYLTCFGEYESFQDLVKNHLDSKMVREIRRRQRKLESSFDVEYIMYYGDISKEEYIRIMDNFYKLLKKKYNYKKQYFSHISDKNWKFYNSLIYPMILEKKASLLVIKANKKPISIELSFHSENTMYGSIPTDDPSFFKYGIGKLRLLKQFEFCFKESLKILDLKGGEFGYKKKWCNQEYYFEYHIYYDSASFKSKLIANILVYKHRFDKRFNMSRINLIIHNLKFLLRKHDII